LKVRAVPLMVRLPPKLIASLARVVKVPADLLYPPLKLIVPAAVVFWIVPPDCVTSPLNEMLPAPLIVRVPADRVKPEAFAKETLPVETLMVCVFVAESVGVPAIVRVFAPTARVIATFTLFGLIERFPVVPLMVKLPLLIVRVVAVAVAFPIVSDPHTAAELIDRLMPELMTASSEDVGTCPRLQVAASHVVPAEAVFVAARAM